MLEKLEDIEKKFYDIGEKISDPAIIAKQDIWRNLMIEHSNLSPVVEKFQEYKQAEKEIKEALELLDSNIDDDFKDLVKEELAENKNKSEHSLEDLKVLLLPKDPNDHKNVIVEIRGGAGGDEAALFAANLFRMYSRYAERNKWKIDVLSMTELGIGGVKEVIFQIDGNGAYSRLKYESGVHRVQRVPSTESSGRIHTSTVTVAVLPEADELDIEVSQTDLHIDVFRSSGKGGQHVNTTDSAVRITHEPTGIVVSCQDERSQLQNKAKAMAILRAKIYELELARQKSDISDERRSQVGTGDRSERIRTYNFPQGRVTDHRISLTLHHLDAILDGDLDEVMDALITSDQAEKLKAK